MIYEDSGLNDITWPENVDREENRAAGKAWHIPTFRGKEPERRL